MEDNRAVGIRLADGEEFYADDIVSAADGYTTIYKLLERQIYLRRNEKSMRNYPLFPPNTPEASVWPGTWQVQPGDTLSTGGLELQMAAGISISVSISITLIGLAPEENGGYSFTKYTGMIPTG